MGSSADPEGGGKECGFTSQWFPLPHPQELLGPVLKLCDVGLELGSGMHTLRTELLVWISPFVGGALMHHG